LEKTAEKKAKVVVVEEGKGIYFEGRKNIIF
jgi:hypothetical protein